MLYFNTPHKFNKISIFKLTLVSTLFLMLSGNQVSAYTELAQNSQGLGLVRSKPKQLNHVYTFYTDNELNGLFVTSDVITNDPKRFYIFGIIQGMYATDHELITELYPTLDMLTIYNCIVNYYINTPEKMYRTITEVILEGCKEVKPKDTPEEIKTEDTIKKEKPKIPTNVLQNNTEIKDQPTFAPLKSIKS